MTGLRALEQGRPYAVDGLRNAFLRTGSSYLIERAASCVVVYLSIFFRVSVIKVSS